MKFNLILFLCLLLITSCAKKETPKDINSILMSIKDYSCAMSVDVYSNKNSTTYIANQTYSYPDEYSIEFLNSDNMRIEYLDSTLNIKSTPLGLEKNIENYSNINTNPLFLSYFLNTYFSSENFDNVTLNKNEVTLILPNNNALIHHAKLTLENNLPKSLTYFDENGICKVNIIYNEFNLNRS